MHVTIRDASAVTSPITAALPLADHAELPSSSPPANVGRAPDVPLDASVHPLRPLVSEPLPRDRPADMPAIK